MYRECRKCGKRDYIPDGIRVNPIMEGLCLDCISNMIEERRSKNAAPL